MIRLEHIHKTFLPNTPDENQIFKDFSFHVARGEFISLLGPNGSGKSTLLNLLAGSIHPNQGTITVEGQPITDTPEHHRAAYISRVFQNPHIGTAPSLTIA